MAHLRDIRGIGQAHRLTRSVVHEIAASIRAGDREVDVTRRLESALKRYRVSSFFHSPYAWWGDRTAFARFVDWEPDAVPTTRRIEEGEPFILDVAPIVDGYLCDYAFGGVLDNGSPTAAAHAELRRELAELKEAIPAMATKAPDSASLYRAVSDWAAARGLACCHPRAPYGVLGHVLKAIPRPLELLPRIGDGFQLALLATYAMALAMHGLGRGRYPFIDHKPGDPPAGIYSLEPHIARGDVGLKFESILVIDGSETRWVDPGLFGDVQG